MEIQKYAPYLSVNDAESAIAFYSRVFATDPWLLLNLPDGRVMHSEFRVGDTRFFLSDELPEHGGTPSPKTLGGTTVAIHLYVSDCDKLVNDMVNNGSELLMEPADMFWGDRFSRVRDPFGHEWGISTKLKEISPEEIRKIVENIFKNAEE